MSMTIGIHPHKGSHTAFAIDGDEHPIARLTVTADRCQTQRLLAWAEPTRDTCRSGRLHIGRSIYRARGKCRYRVHRRRSRRCCGEDQYLLITGFNSSGSNSSSVSLMAATCF